VACGKKGIGRSSDRASGNVCMGENGTWKNRYVEETAAASRANSFSSMEEK
jgi:hypothetical protein